MSRFVSVLFDEAVNGCRIEAQEVSPFYVRNSPLENEPADVTHVDAESLRDLFD